MPTVIALGELLIDFIPTISGVSLGDVPTFQKTAGGAPANVAVGLAKLGVSSGFMGKVGQDAFGQFLARTLAAQKVDTSALVFSEKAHTALAFVNLRADGRREREFVFYHQPSADTLYTPDEVDPAYIQSARMFHFGSMSLINEPVRSATLHAVQIAEQAGLTVSYDPNLRLNLWPDSTTAQAGMMTGWQRAQVIKVNAEELVFLSQPERKAPAEIDGFLLNLAELEGLARALWHPGLRLLVVTRGQAGCAYFSPRFCGELNGFEVDVVDASGAGDGFMAGLLKGLREDPIALENEDRLRAACRYANAVGALTTLRRGAISSLPTSAEVSAFLTHLVPV